MRSEAINNSGLCKYHHNDDPNSVSDEWNEDMEKKRCPGCGRFYVDTLHKPDFLFGNVCNNNYSDLSDDDENDFEMLQNLYEDNHSEWWW